MEDDLELENALLEYVEGAFTGRARKKFAQRLSADAIFRAEICSALRNTATLIAAAARLDDKGFFDQRRKFIESGRSDRPEIHELKRYYLSLRSTIDFDEPNNPDYEDRLGSVMSEFEEELLRTLPLGKKSSDKSADIDAAPEANKNKKSRSKGL